jgi:hypothetical protein
MKVKARRPERCSGETAKATSRRVHARRVCDQKSLPRRRRRRKLSAGVRWPRRYSEIEVFDFGEKWPLVRPFLRRPEIDSVLERGLNEYFQCRRLECLRLDLGGKGWEIKFDATRGPWSYCSSDFWHTRADDLTYAAIERGEFQWQCVDDEEPTEAEWERYFVFSKQFYPQPDTFQWFQLWGACHWLAPWLKELGKLVFPELHWRILSGPRHSLACGIDEARNIKVLFDILNFEEMSARELIEFASYRPRRRSARKPGNTR